MSISDSESELSMVTGCAKKTPSAGGVWALVPTTNCNVRLKSDTAACDTTDISEVSLPPSLPVPLQPELEKLRLSAGTSSRAPRAARTPGPAGGPAGDPAGAHD